MATLIGSLLRPFTRTHEEPLNILTFCTHERYETGLAKTNHRFYAVRAEGIKDWNFNYAPLPENYTLLDKNKAELQVPIWLDFDLVLSQNKFGQFQIAKQFADKLHVPLISLEHTLPPPNTSEAKMNHLKSMKGDFNVFISEFSREEWGWSKDEADVIVHGVDTDLFTDYKVENRQRVLLSVVNDWRNRDWCCGFNLWRTVTKDLPVAVLGDNPGISRPAASTADLVRAYNDAQVFLNTSLVSPVPTVLMEAMACGCAVVSTCNCMIPEIIKHGKNGMLANDPRELRELCEMLLNNKELCNDLGQEARKTIVEQFGMNAFVKNWNNMFDKAKNVFYKV